MNKWKFLILLAVMTACHSDGVHKELVDIKKSAWPVKQQIKFEFEISDIDQSYNFNYLLRNSPDFPFYNIYLKSWLKDSTGKVIKDGMEELMLFDQTTGKPLGDGMGDIFDHNIRAAQYHQFKFPYKGKYTFELQHNMRPDPLPGVMSVGFEIEKYQIK